jgi:hypothetical protein
MSKEEDATISNLILNGGLETVGVDKETGELLYSFTPKIQELMPELYKEHLNEVNAGIMDLWENGFVNIELFSNNPTVTLTDKAFNEESLKGLSKSQRWNLLELIRLLHSKT